MMNLNLFNVQLDVAENLIHKVLKNIKKSVKKYFKLKENNLILKHKE